MEWVFVMNRMSSQSSSAVQRRRMALGVVILLLVDVIWVASSELTSYIFKQQDYNKPFFSTFTKTSMFVLYLLGFLLWRPWRQQCTGTIKRRHSAFFADAEAYFARCNSDTAGDDCLSEPLYVPVKFQDLPNETSCSLIGECETTSSKKQRVRFSNIMEVRQLPSTQALEAMLQTVGKLTITDVAKISFFFCFVEYMTYFNTFISNYLPITYIFTRLIFKLDSSSNLLGKKRQKYNHLWQCDCTFYFFYSSKFTLTFTRLKSVAVVSLVYTITPAKDDYLVSVTRYFAGFGRLFLLTHIAGSGEAAGEADLGPASVMVSCPTSLQHGLVGLLWAPGTTSGKFGLPALEGRGQLTHLHDVLKRHALFFLKTAGERLRAKQRARSSRLNAGRPRPMRMNVDEQRNDRNPARPIAAGPEPATRAL
ncbi:hypothetical protein WMY93_002131 [Mugilogobius chulae]|uniref:Solute carrier family 35 member F5 n=1 Tax=Mugilogobius chulae TaxID=88201 RepID=A0AAW0PUY9_9GOBI